MVGVVWPGAEMSSMETPWTPPLANPWPPTNIWISGSVEPEFPESTIALGGWPPSIGPLATTIGWPL